MFSYYTNTSSAKAIVGLFAITLGSAYIRNHADEIVNGLVSIGKSGADQVDQAIHWGKKKYSVCERTYDGRIRDTGKRIWY